MLVKLSSFFHCLFNNLTFTTNMQLVTSYVQAIWNVFLEAIWNVFLEEHITFCDEFDIILKQDPETIFLKTNIRKCNVHEKCLQIMTF